MFHRRIGLLGVGIVVFVIWAATSAAWGQRPAAAPAATRADLAAAYLAFEEAFAATPHDGAMQRYVHRDFDYAASLFFAGRLNDAVERMNRLTLLIQQHAIDGAIDRNAAAAAHSLQVHFSPATLVLTDDAPRVTRARIRSMYAVREAHERTIDITLRLVDSSDTTVWQRDLTLTYGGGTAQRIIELDDLPEDLGEGSFRALIGLRNSPLPPRVAGRFLVAHEPVAVRRAALLARLSDVAAENDADDLDRAIATCRARIELLTDQPSPLNSIEFLLDPVAHARDVASEVASIAAGRNPYRNMTGEHWRIVARETGNSPLMVYAPADLSEEERLPLVIALHGAGGDEALFMRAYGAGMIRDLAKSRRFLVASPLTYHVMGDATVIDCIIDDLSADYTIDGNRIYLIGHSLGAGTTSVLLNLQPKRYAGTVCIAGAGPFNSPDSDAYPPVLVIAAELDTIITPLRLHDLAVAGRERGLPIEFRVEENLGHVLVVNEVLEDAIDWLLSHGRGR